MMNNFSAIFNWKLIAALGLSVFMAIFGTIAANKMSPEAVERVSIHAIDAFKEIPAFFKKH